MGKYGIIFGLQEEAMEKISQGETCLLTQFFRLPFTLSEFHRDKSSQVFGSCSVRDQ